MVVKDFLVPVCRFKVVRSKPRRIGALGLLALSLAGSLTSVAQAQGQGTAQGVITNAVAAPVMTASAASKLQGHPLFWADGITRTADLDAYKEAGFNVVVVRLQWSPSATGEFSAADLAPQRAFATAAAGRGMMVVYSLPAVPTGFEASLRLSADSTSYTTLWTSWVEGAIANLGTTPNLLGWMLPDDPRDLPIFDDTGFERWVARNYATVDVLNAQWGTKLTELGDVSMADVKALSDHLHQYTLVLNSMSDADAQKRVEAAKTPVNPNLPFHPAALALAAYKWDAYRDLMKAWVDALRSADGGRHLIFSGQLPDYAQLLSQPQGVDVVLPHIAPGIARDDIVTHNPQAIDIARRGGKFGALPTFSARDLGTLPQADFTNLLGRWVDTARARGAVGAGFDSWDALKRNATLRDAVGQKLKAVAQGQEAKLWGTAPTCTTAVLLTPLADGTMVRVGETPTQLSRGLYGFGDDIVTNEPSNLVWSLRWGTAFGGVDYLSPDDINTSLENRYTTILAPQLLSCPHETGASLANFIFNGGTLVTDLGLGALQSGGQASAIPPQMAQIFGVPGTYDLKRTSFNLNGAFPHPLFRAWSDVIAARDNSALTMGEAMGSKAFNGPVGFSAASPVAQTLAVGPQIVQNYGVTKRALRASLTVNDAGRGYAIFAPFQLWSYWRPGNIGFDGFHGDLWARGATLAENSSALVPSPALADPGQTRFAEIDNRSDSITLTNHDAPGQPAKFSSIQTTGTGDWLWTGTTVLLSNDAQSLLSSGRPAPIGNPKEFEARPRPLSIYTTLPAGTSKVLRMVPISVQNMEGGPLCAQVEKVQPSEVVVNVWPNANTVVPSDDSWQPTISPASTCRFTMHSMEDGYRMTPGSRHRVVVTDYTKQVKKGFLTTENILTADRDGHLMFEFSGGACRIRISSAEAPLVAAETAPPLVTAPTPAKK